MNDADRMELRSIADELDSLCAGCSNKCLCCSSARRIRTVLMRQPAYVPRGQRPESENFKP